MDQHQQNHHHPFVDLDQHDHHQAQTDAEALEAIRVAIGQSADFNNQPLSDVLHDNDNDNDNDQSNGGMEVQHDAGPSGSGGHSTLMSIIEVEQMDKALNALLEVSQAAMREMEEARPPLMSDGLARITQLGKKQLRMTQDLINQLKQQVPGLVLHSDVDPALQDHYVSKPEYDALRTKYDALVLGNAATTASKSRKRARPSTAQQQPADSEMTRGASSTPIDEKSRKKRSMKLEHLVHQQANRRLGIEYNVSKFESKGDRYLPDPESAPKGPMESVNHVQEFRPDFRADAKAPTVQPFLEQVTADVIAEWEGGVSFQEPSSTHEKIRESVEVYWVRLGKRWDEQCIRAQGGVHKDELVRRKQNQYRRQQSLVARRQAAFDQSPLNVCKLRSLYRTLLTIDFAAKTDERPDPKRAYTQDEWYAYRRQQYGIKEYTAHECLDQFWLSPTVRSLLCVLDVFATDYSSRQKRKGKPKSPAPGFHLPAELWDRSTLPVLKPKDADGLPIQSAAGAILFRFHVDEKVIAENPEWAEGLYDNPPIPEGDQLLQPLHDVMNSGPYQHLRPIIKSMREFHNVRRLTQEEVETINSTPTDMMEGTVGPIMEAFQKSEPLHDLSDVNLDISLDTLVDMTENQYMAAGLLDSQLAHLEGNGDTSMGSGSAVGTPTKLALGTSVHARKMGKRTALQPPGGAAMPVPKRMKSEGETMGTHEYNEAEGDLVMDAGFLEAL